MFSLSIFLVLSALTSAFASERDSNFEHRGFSNSGPEKRSENEVQHAELRPVSHPELDRSLLEHLTPGRGAPLFWSHDGTVDFASGPLTASLNAQYKSLEVVLDNSDFVSLVRCTSTTISITFNDPTGFHHAEDQWSTAAGIIFISSANDCHPTSAGHYGFFNSSGSAITYDQTALKAVVQGQPISIKEAVHEFKIDWENHDPGISGNPELKARMLKPAKPAKVKRAKVAKPIIAAGCKQNNCLRNLQNKKHSSIASGFCVTYTAAPNSQQSAIPSLFRKACGRDPSAMSSACSCLIPAKTSAPATSTAILSTSTSISERSARSQVSMLTSIFSTTTVSSSFVQPFSTSQKTGSVSTLPQASSGAAISSFGQSTLIVPASSTLSIPSSMSTDIFSSAATEFPIIESSQGSSISVSTKTLGSFSSAAATSLLSPSISTFQISPSSSIYSSALPSSSTRCGAMPNIIPASLAAMNFTMVCGDTFDTDLDGALGFLNAAANLTEALSSYVPGVKGVGPADFKAATGEAPFKARRDSTLSRRGPLDDACSWVDHNIIQPVVNYVIVFIVDAVANLIAEAAELARIARAAMAAVQDAIAALLPQYHPSISFGIPIDIEVPDWLLVESPWGKAFKFYDYAELIGDINYVADTGTLSTLYDLGNLVPSNISGEGKAPNPGVQLYCVDCTVVGHLVTRGTATFTLLIGFTDLQISFNGNLDVKFQLGMNAFAEYTIKLAELRVFELGIPGFFIPGVIIVGPMITLGADATVKIEAQGLGQVLAGARYSFPHVGATIDFLNPNKMTSHGTTPVVSTVFDANCDLDITASIGLPLAIAFGIDILEGYWSKKAAVVVRPAIEAVARFAAPTTDPTVIDINGGTCDGIAWYVNFVNEFSAELLETKYDIGTYKGPHLAEGCVVTAHGTSTTTKASLPTPTPAPPPESAHGCPLLENAVQNSGFDQNSGVPNGWHLLDDFGAVRSWGAGPDGSTTSPPNSAYLNVIPVTSDFEVIFGLATTVTVCTDTQYDMFYQVRYTEGDSACWLDWMSIGRRTTGLGDFTGDDTHTPIYPSTPGKDFMSEHGPFTFAVTSVGTYYHCKGIFRGIGCYYQNIPSDTCHCEWASIDATKTWSDDHASVTAPLTIQFKCLYGTQAQIRVDDVVIVPHAWNAKRKRDAWERQINGTREFDNPVTVAPPVPTVAPVANIQRRTAHFSSMTFSPLNKTVSASLADGTNTATSVGSGTYSFPPLESMLANATLAAPASPTATGLSTNSSKFIALRDNTGILQLSAHTDGNLYLTTYPGTFPGTSFLTTSSIVTGDEQGRSFHYHPNTMEAYGVSRLRLSITGNATQDSRLLTLLPISTSVGTVYAATDTLGNVFRLAWCNAVAWAGAKVFLMKDGNGLGTLMGKEVQWIVTGEEVSVCHLLLLTSGEKALA